MARIYKATIMCRDSELVLVEPGLHYQTDLGGIASEPDPDDVASAIWSHIESPFGACHPVSLHIDELVVVEQVLKPFIGAVGAHSVNGAGFLPVGDAKLPDEMVPLVSWFSAVHSRSARGHTFFGSVGDAGFLSADGKWTTTYLNTLTGLANACITTIDMGDPLAALKLHPVIYSRTRHQRGETPYVFNVTGHRVRPQATWLRSRGTVP